MHGRHFDRNSVAYLGLSAMRNRPCNRITDDSVTCHMRLASPVYYLVCHQIDAERCSYLLLFFV